MFVVIVNRTSTIEQVFSCHDLPEAQETATKVGTRIFKNMPTLNEEETYAENDVKIGIYNSIFNSIEGI